MFSATLPLKSTTSWSTVATRRRRLGLGHLANVDAVHQDPAAVDVVQTREQLDEGGLPGPGRPHEGDPLAGRDPEGEVPQDPACSHGGGALGQPAGGWSARGRIG